MAKTQPFLFETGIPERDDAGLMLTPRADRPLTKAQRAFNRLVARVEELRARIATETKILDEAVIYYGSYLHPRLQRQNEMRKDLVRLLSRFLNKKSLRNKSDRQILRTIISDLLDQIVFHEGSLTDADLRAVFKQIHQMDVEQARQQDIEESRSEMEAMLDELGVQVDLSGLHAGLNEEELAAKMAELAATIKDKAEAKTAEHSFGRSKRPKGRRRLEKEQPLRQAEEVRKKSISTIYKELAKILHPDLEQDPERRQRKVVLMQELTVAYRNNDLHTLLRLELEWIQGEKGNLDRMTEEKLAVYNQVLKDQVAELENQLQLLPQHHRYRVLAVPDDFFGFRMRTDGPAEACALDETIARMEGTITSLRSQSPMAAVRGIIRAYKAIPPIEEWDDLEEFSDEDLPF
jgi:hypothetical protein